MHHILFCKIKAAALGVLCFLAYGAASYAAVPPLPTAKPGSAVLADHSADHSNNQTNTTSVTAAQGVPVPPQRPDFSRPDVMQLLAFGEIPIPKAKPMGQKGAGLAAEDARIYRRIFAAQDKGDWSAADALMGRLGDFRLRGHVLYQRYMHPTAYRATFDELAAWLDVYHDHPGADRVFSLAQSRAPDSFRGTLKRPDNNDRIRGYLPVLSDNGSDYISPQRRQNGERKQIDRLNRAIMAKIRAGAPTEAYKILTEDRASRLLDTVEFDQLRSLIAHSYRISGMSRHALDLAQESARRSGNQAPQAGWAGGLAAWQNRLYDEAASLFALAATSPYNSPWEASAAAYWASRAHMRAGNTREVNQWLRQAASNPRTFYGLIATRALGWDFDFNWNGETFGTAQKEILMRYPATERALLLASTGQYQLAEAELRQIDPSDSAVREALLSFAESAGLPSYAMRLAHAIPAENGRLYDSALYPVPPWEPTSGYKVDRALVYAFIRQESRFNPGAQNRTSGATGLMQLMPSTASYIAGNNRFGSAEGREQLKDPQVNLDLGQRYIRTLLNQSHVNDDLLSLAIAYNAGQGNLRRWKQEFSSMLDDPLLFIESIPMRETRIFVERVMANYWIYRLRMGQPVPTLDAVAQGEWAQYAALDNHYPVPDFRGDSGFLLARQ